MRLWLDVLSSPRRSFVAAADGGSGLWPMVVVLGLETLLLYRLSVAGAVMQAAASAPAAVVALWSVFVHHAGPVFVGAGAIAVVLQLASRKLGRRRELWHLLAAVGLSLVPHLVLVALLAGLELVGVTAPQWLSRGWVGFVPSAIVLGFGVDALFRRPPTGSAADHRLVLASRLALAAVLLVGLTSAGLHVARDWRRVRPVLPGDTLAAFELKGLDGAQLRSRDLAGKAVLIDFWATWCAPCVAAMPSLVRLHEDLGPKGLTLVSVNVEADDTPAVRAFLEHTPLPFPIWLDRGALQSRLRVQSYPTMFLVDPSGVVRHVHVGPQPYEALRDEVAALLPPDSGRAE